MTGVRWLVLPSRAAPNVVARSLWREPRSFGTSKSPRAQRGRQQPRPKLGREPAAQGHVQEVGATDPAPRASRGTEPMLGSAHGLCAHAWAARADMEHAPRLPRAQCVLHASRPGRWSQRPRASECGARDVTPDRLPDTAPQQPHGPWWHSHVSVGKPRHGAFGRLAVGRLRACDVQTDNSVTSQTLSCPSLLKASRSAE